MCPFHNERENLPELAGRLEKVVRALPGPAELVLVDDGSTDGGAETLKPVLKSGITVSVLHLEERRGLTTALYAGLQAAKGDVLATLDADLHNPPEEIPRLLSQLDDCDIVAGVRRRRDDDWLRRISSTIANNIRRFVILDHIQDIGCSLRVFRRETLKSFYPYTGMHRFFLAVAEHDGFKIKQVPVDHEARKRGKAKYGLLNRLLGPLWDLIAVRWLLTRRIQYKIRSMEHG